MSLILMKTKFSTAECNVKHQSYKPFQMSHDVLARPAEGEQLDDASNVAAQEPVAEEPQQPPVQPPLPQQWANTDDMFQQFNTMFAQQSQQFFDTFDQRFHQPVMQQYETLRTDIVSLND